MRMLFISPRRYGMLGTAATYHLIEAYARHTKIRVVANARRDRSAPIVHAPPPDLDLHEVAFRALDYAQRIAVIAKEYDPDIVCLANWTNWPLRVATILFCPRTISSDRLRCSRFVFIGSYYMRERRLDRMVDLIACLPDPIKARVTFDMFGDGTNERELIGLVHTRQLETVVRVNGALPQAELFKILPDYDAGLAWIPPSLKAVEYFGSGLGVVASATTGHRRDVDEGFRAILFEENSQSFTDTIRQATDNGIPRSDIERNLELIKQRDWDRIVSNVSCRPSTSCGAPQQRTSCRSRRR